jgi:hypothetical protein
MFGYNDLLYYFANVKIEQSDPKSYAQDREVVIRSLKSIDASTKLSGVIQTGKISLNARSVCRK